MVGLQLLVELLLGIRSLHLGQLGLHVLGRRGQIHLGRALGHNLLVDQLAHNVQPQRVGLLGRGLLVRRVAQLRLVHAIHVGAHNRVAVHRGHHVRAVRAVASAEQKQRHRQRARSTSSTHTCDTTNCGPVRRGRSCCARHVRHSDLRSVRTALISICFDFSTICNSAANSLAWSVWPRAARLALQAWAARAAASDPPRSTRCR